MSATTGVSEPPTRSDTDRLAASGSMLTDGRYSPIVYPGAGFTTANRVNYSREIVGTWADTPESEAGHAFVLTQRGFTSIDFPDATQTTGRDINDQGHIVGSYRDEAGYVHGYLRLPRKAGR